MGAFLLTVAASCLGSLLALALMVLLAAALAAREARREMVARDAELALLRFNAGRRVLFRSGRGDRDSVNAAD